MEKNVNADNRQHLTSTHHNTTYKGMLGKKVQPHISQHAIIFFEQCMMGFSTILKVLFTDEGAQQTGRFSFVSLFW